MNIQRAWSLILLLSAVAAGIVAFALSGTIICLAVIVWFLLVCPGMMVVRFLKLKEPLAEWVLAIALSLAIDAIVASIALYADAWFPPGILGTLIAICIFGVMVQFVLTRSDPTTPPGMLLRKSGRLVSLFLLLLLVSISGMGVWSYNMRPHAATTASAASHQPPQPASPTATPSRASVIDTVIVMDNVDFITKYDPQGDRYKAAQLFASMLPMGSEIGIVRITSRPISTPMLALHALKANSDRALVMNTLTEKTFGPVDPSPIAYFSPALTMAGSMLLARPAGDRKLILIFTDALAFSGDQGACRNSPGAYHTWFCTVETLERQGITVALVGFTFPAQRNTLQPLQQSFATYGGIALPVSDSPNMAAQLTSAYRTLLGVAQAI